MAAFRNDSIFWVEVEKIVPNPYQPRRVFEEGKLKELSESIRMYGVLQPLTVSRVEVELPDGAFRTEYELIAGERRLRASKLAGLSQVPVLIREGEESEQEKLELAIIENLQREDLNAVDRALAFRQLADVFGLSHSQVAKKVGRSREYVSNTIRLLGLPDYMLQSLREADINEGHARTLLMLNDRPEEQDTVYREILLKKLSVREVERIARKIATDKVRSQKWQDSDPELIEKEKEFTETLGTRVQLVKTDYGGKITIDYFSDEDLENFLAMMKRSEKRFMPSVATVVANEVSSTEKETEAALAARQDAMSAITAATALEVTPEAVVVPEVVEEVASAPVEITSEVAEEAPEPSVAVSTVTEEVALVSAEVTSEMTEEVLPDTPSDTEPEIPSEMTIIEEVSGAPTHEEVPVSSPEVPTPPVATTAPRSSLRDRLAQLFSEPKPVATPAPATLPTPEPVVEEVVIPEPEEVPAAVVPQSEPSPAPEKKDDDDIYNIKNFSI